jgi:hypothetical protein
MMTTTEFVQSCKRAGSNPENRDARVAALLAYLVAVGPIANEAKLCHVGAGAAIGAPSHAHHQWLISLEPSLQHSQCSIAV